MLCMWYKFSHISFLIKFLINRKFTFKYFHRQSSRLDSRFFGICIRLSIQIVIIPKLTSIFNIFNFFVFLNLAKLRIDWCVYGLENSHFQWFYLPPISHNHPKTSSWDKNLGNIFYTVGLLNVFACCQSKFQTKLQTNCPTKLAPSALVL